MNEDVNFEAIACETMASKIWSICIRKYARHENNNGSS